ncbi:hypothetical protein CHRY9293_01888 [Chryseobacterium potabilaquae]|uniref:Uncharacterized protein n=1 Tax=Chryseobacterium potabilaquae TaxID=2675057 RepID=A0A6N4X6F0_9FLAO|nr:hypothetical protein CHRY9293_01888 [Chryseobacterium potabilaquae]
MMLIHVLYIIALYCFVSSPYNMVEKMRTGKADFHEWLNFIESLFLIKTFYRVKKYQC